MSSAIDKAESAWSLATDTGWKPGANGVQVRCITFAYPISLDTCRVIARATLRYDSVGVTGDPARCIYELTKDGRTLTLHLPAHPVASLDPVPVPAAYTTESLHGAHLAPVRYDN